MESIETPTEEAQGMKLPEVADYCIENDYALIFLPPKGTAKGTLILPPDVTARLLGRETLESQDSDEDSNLLETLRLCRAYNQNLLIRFNPDAPEGRNPLGVTLVDGHLPITDAALQSLRRLLAEQDTPPLPPV